MKTQIITLESHDDLISVRDKLSWAKTPRILLVWPKYEKVTLRVLDLKVLQRHAGSLGSQLGLVTRRANVRRDAESLERLRPEPLDLQALEQVLEKKRVRPAELIVSRRDENLRGPRLHTPPPQCFNSMRMVWLCVLPTLRTW